MRRPAAGLALCLAFATGALAQDDPAARGAYLARIMDCAGCHTPKLGTGAPDASRPLAGGSIGFDIPGLGIFWAPNLTPHREALGGWSDAEIGAALTTGMRPDGRILAPAMPWMSYAALEPRDVAALVAYLRTLPPDPGQTPPIAGTAASASGPYFTVVQP